MYDFFYDCWMTCLTLSRLCQCSHLYQQWLQIIKGQLGQSYLMPSIGSAKQRQHEYPLWMIQTQTYFLTGFIICCCIHGMRLLILWSTSSATAKLINLFISQALDIFTSFSFAIFYFFLPASQFSLGFLGLELFLIFFTFTAQTFYGWGCLGGELQAVGLGEALTKILTYSLPSKQDWSMQISSSEAMIMASPYQSLKVIQMIWETRLNSAWMKASRVWQWSSREKSLTSSSYLITSFINKQVLQCTIRMYELQSITPPPPRQSG